MEIKITIPEVLEFSVAGQTVKVPTADLTPEAVNGLFLYGRRKMNDVFNSAKAGDKPLTVEEVTKKIVTWDFKSGGFTRVDAYTKALREVVAGYLKSTGMKGNEAAKAAKDPQQGLKVALGLILAKKRKPLSELVRYESW